MEPDKHRAAALVEQVRAMELAGADKPGHADHWRRTELMDELQDAVGLSGKMVTDRDIMKKAEQLLR
jgi:hypothetical protein